VSSECKPEQRILLCLYDSIDFPACFLGAAYGRGDNRRNRLDRSAAHVYLESCRQRALWHGRFAGAGYRVRLVDEGGLVKPKAFVVLKQVLPGDDALRLELQEFVKARLAPYKYPRYIEFVSELPKTAAGKLQRFLLVRREKERLQQENRKG
jgi:acyl-CoA synthetase (AMP-forming)/AMP-acid ligase II